MTWPKNSLERARGALSAPVKISEVFQSKLIYAPEALRHE
jgi:hypothetical protein